MSGNRDQELTPASVEQAQRIDRGQETESRRREALDELTARDQELGLQ